VNILNGRSDSNALFRQPHVAGEGTMRRPRGTLPRCCLLKHLVNLFQAQALHLRYQEIGEHDGETAQ